MKTTATQSRLAFLTNIFAFIPLCASLAADTNASPAEAVPAQPGTTANAPALTPALAPAKLPYGVDDVLKLSRAQIGDEVILNYVQSSGTIYNLTPKDIVYLRDQGVSEKIIKTMLEQRKRVELASQNVPAAPVSAPDSAAAMSAQATPNGAVAATGAAYADPNATYAEAPLTPPASSVYVVPYSTYPYYGSYYPYYYGGWYGPSISLGFRFGGHGYYRGGYHGGHGSYGGHSSGGGHHR